MKVSNIPVFQNCYAEIDDSMTGTNKFDQNACSLRKLFRASLSQLEYVNANNVSLEQDGATRDTVHESVELLNETSSRRVISGILPRTCRPGLATSS